MKPLTLIRKDLISDQTDERLAVLAQAGQLSAFTILVRRYEQKLRRYVEFLVFDENLVDDVLQESMIKVYQNLKSFNPKQKFSSWIYRIVHNQSINLSKKNSQKSGIKIDTITWERIASSENLQKSLEKKEQQLRLNEILSTMPKQYLEPLWLYFFEDKSYEEIANILWINQNLVGVRINRVKKLLKQKITKEDL